MIMTATFAFFLFGSSLTSGFFAHLCKQYLS
jgi:hypothetical protein